MASVVLLSTIQSVYHHFLSAQARTIACKKLVRGASPDLGKSETEFTRLARASEVRVASVPLQRTVNKANDMEERPASKRSSTRRQEKQM